MPRYSAVIIEGKSKSKLFSECRPDVPLFQFFIRSSVIDLFVVKQLMIEHHVCCIFDRYYSMRIPGSRLYCLSFCRCGCKVSHRPQFSLIQLFLCIMLAGVPSGAWLAWLYERDVVRQKQFAGLLTLNPIQFSSEAAGQIVWRCPSLRMCILAP